MRTSEKRFDVVVIGEINVDLILHQLPEMPVPGKEIFAQQMTLTLGSSAAILASNLSSFGARVAFFGIAGMDMFGQLAIDKLKKAGVDTAMIIRDPTLQTGASIGLQHVGDRGMVTYAGAMEHLTFEDVPVSLLHEARHLHFSSYFFQPGMQAGLPTLFRTAKHMGLSTSFDMQTDPAQRWEIDYHSILPYVDIFFPNENELLNITGIKDIDEAAEHISNLVPVLALKLGSKGSVTIHEGRKEVMEAMPVKQIVDAIGAGDSFNAGFLYHYLQNAPISTCQQYGNIAGAISTMAPGGISAFHEQKSLDQYAKEQFGHTGSFVT